jgi:hypothetical protein
MRTLALTLAAAALLVAAVPAAATEVTRTTYTAQVEPVCKANSQANEKILKGVRGKVKAGKLDAAAAQFSAAAAALEKTLTELKGIPQPPADKAKLTKWLSYVKAEADLFEATAKKLAADDKAGAQAMVIRLTHNANLANNQTLGFEFDYCRFDPSQYT